MSELTPEAINGISELLSTVDNIEIVLAPAATRTQCKRLDRKCGKLQASNATLFEENLRLRAAIAKGSDV